MYIKPRHSSGFFYTVCCTLSACRFPCSSYHCLVLIFPNLHTHIPQPDNPWQIMNVHEKPEALLPAVCSIGLHPWYLDEKTWKESFSQVKQLALQPEVLAIGECGLDTLCPTPFALQQKVFTEQVLLANTLNKPLIIHCVRAHAAVVQILQDLQVSVPVIFHGFNRNIHIAQQLLAHHYYLSFGKALFNGVVRKVFEEIPTHAIFLETDHAAISIEDVYSEAAKLKRENLTKFVQQIHQNYFRVFGVRFT